MGKGQRLKNTADGATFAAKKSEGGNKIKTVLIVIAVIAVLVFLVGMTVFNMSKDQGWFEGNEIVMKTDNYSVNQGMFAYFFREVYMNTYNTYYSVLGDSTSQYIDPSKSLKEQAYGGDYETWYDYILAQTKTTVNEYLILCEAAREEGVALGKEERDEINSSLDEIKSDGSSHGFSSAGDYIRALFGTGVNEAKIKKALEIEHLAIKYAQKISDAVDVSDEALEAAYSESPETYDKVSYLTYTFNTDDLLPEEETADDADTTEDAEAAEGADTSAEAAEPTEEEVAAAKEQIKVFAEELAAVKSEDEFKEYVKNYALTVLGKDEDAAATAADGVLKEGASYSESDDAIKWAFGAKAGETNVIEGTDGTSQAVYFLVKEEYRDEEDGSISCRHVLFGTKTEENKDQPDGTEYGYDDPAAKSKEVYDKWVEDGAKEDDIVSLAAQYSTDSTKDSGGLCEGVTKGRFVEPFNSWLFDEEHKEGDHTLLETQYGWHIVYFISKGEPQWKTTVTSNLKTDAYNSAKEAAAEKYTVTTDDSKIEVDA